MLAAVVLATLACHGHVPPLQSPRLLLRPLRQLVHQHIRTVGETCCSALLPIPLPFRCRPMHGFRQVLMPAPCPARTVPAPVPRRHLGNDRPAPGIRLWLHVGHHPRCWRWLRPCLSSFEAGKPSTPVRSSRRRHHVAPSAGALAARKRLRCRPAPDCPAQARVSGTVPLPCRPLRTAGCPPGKLRPRTSLRLRLRLRLWMP